MTFQSCFQILELSQILKSYRKLNNKNLKRIFLGNLSGRRERWNFRFLMIKHPHLIPANLSNVNEDRLRIFFMKLNPWNISVDGSVYTSNCFLFFMLRNGAHLLKHWWLSVRKTWHVNGVALRDRLHIAFNRTISTFNVPFYIEPRLHEQQEHHRTHLTNQKWATFDKFKLVGVTSPNIPKYEFRKLFVFSLSLQHVSVCTLSLDAYIFTFRFTFWLWKKFLKQV